MRFNFWQKLVAKAVMNTAEFEEYLERVRRWAAVEYGVVVPLPNEVEV